MNNCYKNINGIQLAYKVYGQGFPLIFIMGYSGSMDSWPEQMIERLSEKHQVIVYDNRGIARSTVSEEKFSIELFARDVISLMDTLNIDKANILGYSMGVSIALEAALNFSGRVKNLILLGGSCGGKEEISPEPEVLDALNNIIPLSMKDPARFFRLFFTDDWLKTNKPWELMKPPEIIPAQEIVERQYEALNSWQGAYERLSEISQPALIVGADGDVIRPIANTYVLTERIPSAWMVKLQGGHGFLWQHAQELSEIILSFLEINH